MAPTDVTVTVTPVNEAPVITTKSRTEFSLRENSTSNIHTYRATDQDEGDAVTWSLEGADGGDFAVYNGILNFRLLPDLENPVDADRGQRVRDHRGGRGPGGAAGHRRCRHHHHRPVRGAGDRGHVGLHRGGEPRHGPGPGVLHGHRRQGQPPGLPPVVPGGTGRRGLHHQRGLEKLTFRNIPDYDRPADANRDNVYEVTVRGHDSRAYGNLEVTVTVTDINEHAPVVTGREDAELPGEHRRSTHRLHTYRATDGDQNTSVAWSLEG